MWKKIGSLCALGILGSQLLACGSDKSGGATTGAPGAATTATAAKSAATTAPAAHTPPPAPPAPPPAKAAELVDIDLGTADAKWKGWTAKGPADAKVLADGVAGARIAAKGPSILDHVKGGDNGFDVAFAWGKEDLKTLHKNLQKGADTPMGNVKMKLTFVKDEPDLLEWTTEVGETKTYNFVSHMKVGKVEITCKNNYMVGSGNEAEHKRVMEACKTLTKKGK